jgi:hypothetical protein
MGPRARCSTVLSPCRCPFFRWVAPAWAPSPWTSSRRRLALRQQGLGSHRGPCGQEPVHARPLRLRTAACLPGSGSPGSLSAWCSCSGGVGGGTGSLGGCSAGSRAATRAQQRALRRWRLPEAVLVGTLSEQGAGVRGAGSVGGPRVLLLGWAPDLGCPFAGLVSGLRTAWVPAGVRWWVASRHLSVLRAGCSVPVWGDLYEVGRSRRLTGAS